MDADGSVWIDAVNSLEALYGNDYPESQSIALYNATTVWEWGDGVAKVQKRFLSLVCTYNDSFICSNWTPLGNLNKSLHIGYTRYVACE